MSPQAPSCDETGKTVNPPEHLGRYQAGIVDAYFEASEPGSSRTSPSRMLRIAAFGLGGVLACAGIYYVFPDMPGYEIGLVGVAGGWLAAVLPNRWRAGGAPD
jgi:hypothetical protein